MGIFRGKVILVTGGTGSFGKCFIQAVLRQHMPKRLIVYSRDEFKQFKMQEQFAAHKEVMRYFIGDVRDRERLRMALRGVDYVVHAAALKQVPLMEYNPGEAIKTNIIGAMNLIETSIECGVKKVIALSSDKACNPVNLYGATKLCSDKLFVDGNFYSRKGGVRFSVVRYGNVLGSRGGVVEFFLARKKTAILPITDPRMTRFWITLDEAVKFVIDKFKIMEGGEIFVPKIPSMSITDLARAIAPGCRLKTIGIRPGEKLHEVMISEDDSRNTTEFGRYYVIRPAFYHPDKKYKRGRSVPDGFRYSSDSNGEWLSVSELKSLVGGG
ncbi:MAG: UDP-N-acetylglucosamine 4,6-dehydratase (inverting) [Candidatus Omnitrophica bacterium]|nr:UDP-N-acetylglucosamine 4,6-dehydratase (inverting) [Candidatus Omnitrophota bacterium]